jgi:hypothetical protein
MVRLRFVLTALVCSVLLATACEDPVPPPFCDPACEPDPVARTEDELIRQLSKAYQTRDIDLFTKLFPNAADAAPYFFFLNAPVNGIDNWDLTEELRIHRRMFKPEDPLPGETPVPDPLWLASITINLQRTAANWVERTDLYKTPTNPNGLDSAKWKGSRGGVPRRHLVRDPGRYRLSHRRPAKFHRHRRLDEVPRHRTESSCSIAGKISDPPPATKQADEARSWGVVKMLYK